MPSKSQNRTVLDPRRDGSPARDEHSITTALQRNRLFAGAVDIGAPLCSPICV